MNNFTEMKRVDLSLEREKEKTSKTIFSVIFMTSLSFMIIMLVLHERVDKEKSNVFITEVNNSIDSVEVEINRYQRLIDNFDLSTSPKWDDFTIKTFSETKVALAEARKTLEEKKGNLAELMAKK